MELTHKVRLYFVISNIFVASNCTYSTRLGYHNAYYEQLFTIQLSMVVHTYVHPALSGTVRPPLKKIQRVLIECNDYGVLMKWASRSRQIGFLWSGCMERCSHSSTVFSCFEKMNNHHREMIYNSQDRFRLIDHSCLKTGTDYDLIIIINFQGES